MLVAIFYQQILNGPIIQSFETGGINDHANNIMITKHS